MKKQTLRWSGIDLIGYVPWGTHFCQFYGTSQDLIDVLVPYIKAGLDANEFCMWVTADNLNEDQAENALRAAVPDLDRYKEKGQLAILHYTEWYLDDKGFDRHRVLDSWQQKLDQALAMGFDGARVTGDTMWLEKSHWDDFKEYEESINHAISGVPLLVLCTYSLDKCGASEVADVVINHQFALMKREGEWTIIESSDFKQAREDLRSVALFPEQNPFPVLRIASDGTILYANQSSDFLLQNHECRIGGPAPAAWREQLLHALESDSNITTEIRCEDRVFSFVLAPVVEQGYVNLYASDVTVRLRAEEALQETLKQLEARTRALADTNDKLASLNEEMEAANEELQVTTDELLREVQYRRQIEAALRDSEARVRLKLESILSPEGNIGDLEFADIVDVAAIQSSMEDFYALTHIPMAILDTKGALLVGVGWQDVCTQFHRVHPETLRNCIESDTLLTQNVPRGQFRLYKCRNNMWDISTPVIIGREHLANVFSGQFFFDDESPDYDFFRSQARRCGFNEEEYIAAIDRAPRLSRQSVDRAMSFFVKLADLISKASYSNIKLARALTERDRLTQSLQDSQADLNRAQSVAQTGSWRLDVRRNELKWSDETYRIFGIPVGTTLTYDLFLQAVHPDDRERVDTLWNAAFQGEPYDIEHRIVIGDTIKWVRERAELEFDDQQVALGGFGTVQDITKLKEAEEALAEVYEREHRIADMLQKALVPDTEYHNIPGCAVAVRYKPALREAEVGGDFYDVFELGEGRIGITVGDVVGKGLVAAMRVSAARHSIRSYAYLDPRPGNVLKQANEALCRDSYDSASGMLTAFFAVIDTRVGALTCASGGHEPPLLRTPDGAVRELETRGRILGAMEGYVYTESSRLLTPGETLVVVTDGITEARRRPGAMFGVDGVRNYLQKAGDTSVDGIADGILQSAEHFAAGQLKDDAVILVFQFQGAQGRSA